MVSWWSRAAAVALVLAVAAGGCKGSSKVTPRGTHSSAPSAGNGADSGGEGATPAGGEGGARAEAGGRGGTAQGGRAAGSGGTDAAGKGAGGSGGAGAAAGASGASTGGAGSGGTSAVGGNAGGTVTPVRPPAGWRCDAGRYGDGTRCDCGCGVVDADCQDATVGACDTCDAPGACAPGACPGKLEPANNAACTAPPRWSCAPELYYDGVCNCGCGVVDVDCPSPQAADCVSCPTSSCSPFNCAGVGTDDNAECTSIPLSWHCPAYRYGDGSECDCGCGYLDPDCNGRDLDACDACNTEGSCSGEACPGTIDPENVSFCTHPEPPVDWTCESEHYADGLKCDCGCGAPDPDCRTVELDVCERCTGCSTYGCNRVDPDDTTRCLPPPNGWACSPVRYYDTVCDCGCGVRDKDCTIPAPGWCSSCPPESCAEGDCSRIDVNDDTKCN